MLEKEIEDRVCKYARERGFLAYKFTSPNRAAVPDRMFVHPAGLVFFIEFKRSGAKPTPQQEREHIRLRESHVPVYVIDDVSAGKQLIDQIDGKCNRLDTLIHWKVLRDILDA